jgi:hypothetical protein
MKVREFFIDQDVEPQKSLAYRMFDVGVRWTIVGGGALATGAIAEIAGVKEGLDIMIAGFPVEYLGGAILGAATIVGLFSGDDSESH